MGQAVCPCSAPASHLPHTGGRQQVEQLTRLRTFQRARGLCRGVAGRPKRLAAARGYPWCGRGGVLLHLQGGDSLLSQEAHSGVLPEHLQENRGDDIQTDCPGSRKEAGSLPGPSSQHNDSQADWGEACGDRCLGDWWRLLQTHAGLRVGVQSHRLPSDQRLCCARREGGGVLRAAEHNGQGGRAGICPCARNLACHRPACG
mmetsp:Transcript_27071/g.76341  ORF Transcript_27071/g.76341 Transcript_27071/m.76341 type:complete len:202 (-) Transcript_27071:736-1341(-)